MSDYVIMPTQDYQAICDAVREKTGESEPLKSGDVADKVESLEPAGSYQNGYEAGYAVGAAEPPSLTEVVTEFLKLRKTDFNNVFRNCNKLTELDLSHVDTSNVTDMSYMFYNCHHLTKLDLSHFDTSKVLGMNSAFRNCNRLTELDLSHFDTSKVTDMSYMFLYCNSLTKLDLSHFDTSKVTGMTSIFTDCTSLTELFLGTDWSISTNLQSSPLSVDSMKSVITHLKNYTDTNETFSRTLKFSNACWAALEADSTAPDGSTWKEYVESTLCWLT